MFIYKITNQLDQKVYIGLDTASESKSRRWKCHQSFGSGKRKLQKQGCLKYLYSAMLKHGIDSFLYEIIDTASNLEDLKSRERHWIAYYRTLGDVYNLTPGGDVFNTYQYLSEQAKAERGRKIREKLKEHLDNRSPEDRHRKSESQSAASKKGWASLDDTTRERYIERITNDGKKWWETATAEQKAAASAKATKNYGGEKRKKAAQKRLTNETAEAKTAKTEKIRASLLERNKTSAGYKSQMQKAASYSRTYSQLSPDEREKRAEANREKARSFWRNLTPEQRSEFLDKRRLSRSRKHQASNSPE